MNQETAKRRRIVYLITKATRGGAQRYVLDLVRSLPKERFEPLVAYGEKGRLVDELGEGVETRQIPSLKRDVALISDATSFFDMYSLFRERRPDIVHLNSSKAAAIGALAARAARVPRVVFTVHGWPFKEKRSLIVVWLIYVASWLTARLCDKIVVVSSDDIDAGMRMWGVADKVHYIPIGMEPPAFLSKDEAIAQLRAIIPAESISTGSIRIGTIAELTANKGIRYGIEALADLYKRTKDNYIYIIVGDGEQRQELEELARKRGVSDKVFFAGYVANAARLLPAFDVFLLPSIKEGMPYALLEAAESGVCTVATKVANPEIAKQYEHVHVIPAGNMIAISDMIRTLQEKGFPLAQPRAGRFSLQAMVEATLALY